MTIKTGTRTPWLEFEGEILELDRGDRLIYVHPGRGVGDIDYLVEAIRADGAVVNLAAAYRKVDEAKFFVGYCGLTDSGLMAQCDESGETSDGEMVQPEPCIFAVV